MNNLETLQEGKRLLDRIFRKFAYLSKQHPADIYSDHKRLREIDNALGKGWDVSPEGILIEDKKGE